MRHKWSVDISDICGREIEENCAWVAASSGNSRYSVFTRMICAITCALMQHGNAFTERVSVRAGESTNVRNAYLLYFSYLKSIFVHIRSIIHNICLWAYQESHQNVEHALRSSTWRCVKYSYCQWYSFGICWERFHQRYDICGGRCDEHSVLKPY